MLRLLSTQSVDEVKTLLKMGVAAALANICSAPTPFLLFSDVFNTKPINVCQELFAFMEETITTLKDVPLFASGRNTLLRMCNDLLRRLSKSQNTVFCGQIQLFLSRLFPLDEKSGLNLMSNFNLEKETPYNKQPEPSVFKHQGLTDSHLEDLEEGETTDNTPPLEIDCTLYVKFWSLQEFFKVPTLCFDRSKWLVFQSSADKVLEIFSSIKLTCGSEGDTQCETNSAKFSKYLTSEKLLDLQLMDSSFRRYILVQFLIIFQYLTTPTKFKTAEQVLSDEQIEWVNRKREAVLCLLAGSNLTDSHESGSFVSVVERILEREAYWSRWKNDGCPSFVRSSDKSPIQLRKRRVNPLVDRAGNKILRFGNAKLDKLWNVCPDNLAACRDERRLFRPSLQTYFQDAIMELDPSEKVAEEYRSINREEWCWRALRFLSRRSPHFYINWNPPGRAVKDYLTVILTEKIHLEDDKKNARSSDTSASSTFRDSTTEDAGPSPAKQPRTAAETTSNPVDTTATHSRKAKAAVSASESQPPSKAPKKGHSVPKGGGHTGTAVSTSGNRPHCTTVDSVADVNDREETIIDDDELTSKQDVDSDLNDERDVASHRSPPPKSRSKS
ncbi:unnamed protein product [Dicrocoelium dendriticum]|nr:unnamed protein product [Dicrocoelium dendriticum]